MTGTPVRLSEGNIYKQMLRICIPLVAGSLMQQLYTIADSVIVGRFIGTGALAATGACDPVINLLIGQRSKGVNNITFATVLHIHYRNLACC